MSGFDLSYWEKASFFEDVDVCIAGGGLVGLHASIALKERNPELNILILERGFLPYGASTRNAGFACFGSMSELLDDLTRESEDAVFSRVQMRWEGLLRLRQITGDQAIRYEPLGGYELFTKDEQPVYEACMDQLSYLNKRLHEITGIENVYRTADERIPSFGFHGTSQLILNAAEGQIDTGKMMQALEQQARSLGVRMLSGIEIKKIEAGDRPVVHAGNSITFSAGKVMVTTNAFARQLLPELDVRPSRAQVLITAPINGLKFEGSFHYDKGYYYFRNVGDRVLLGGGRNLDFDAEATDSFGLTAPVQQRLEQMLEEVILPDTPYTIAMRWSGIMGLGPDRSPIVKQTGPNIICAVRMGGMGVAIGAVIGKMAAELMDGN